VEKETRIKEIISREGFESLLTVPKPLITEERYWVQDGNAYHCYDCSDLKNSQKKKMLN